MGKQVTAVTTLAFYGPTDYGYGHLLSYSAMICPPKEYRPSVTDSNTIEALLIRLVNAGVVPGTKLRITVETIP